MADYTLNWQMNIGTQSAAVSLLHEYAVALVWDALDNGLKRSSPVRVLTTSGDMSDNLIEGATRIAIPNDMTPVIGVIPDLAIYDDKNIPIRVVEVINSHPVEMHKRQAYEKRGIQMVEVSAKSSSDIQNLCWTPAPLAFWHNVSENPSGQIRIQRYNEDVQRRADQSVRALAQDIMRATPEARRELLHVVRHMSEIEFLYPISADNPKRDVLAEHLHSDVTTPPRPPYWAI